MTRSRKIEGAKMGRPRLPVLPRFEAKYVINPDTGCWDWTAAVDKDGYGKFVWYDSRDIKRERAHRFSYFYFKGEIPSGLCLDHLCRNPRCVNPSHLEAVTNAENLRRGNGPSARNGRKTHCKRGHVLPDERRGRMGRVCPICYKAYSDEYYRSRTAEQRAVLNERARLHMQRRRDKAKANRLSTMDSHDNSDVRITRVRSPYIITKDV